MTTKRATPLSHYAEFQAEYSLSRELPYWDFFDELDSPCVVLADGSLVQGLKLTGIPIETWNADEINRFTGGVRSFLNSLPDEADLQFYIDVNSDFSGLISEHERIKGNDELMAWVADSRIGRLRQAISSQGLQKINTYLFVYLRVRSNQGKLASFFAKPKLDCAPWTGKKSPEFEHRVIS